LDPEIINSPREVNTGDMSTNFTSEIHSLSPQIYDLANGGFIPSEGLVFHNQIYSSQWHRLGFYFELNSSPGIQDGILKFWFDGSLIIDMQQIPWIGNDGSMAAQWNNISFGGNDKYHFNLDESAAISERERWYAIDDIQILDAIPDTASKPESVQEINTSPLEGDFNQVNYYFLEISQALTTNASVDYETFDGTAIAGQDYNASSGTAIIQAGKTHTSIPVTIMGDKDVENNEYFYLKISNPQGAAFPDGVNEIKALRTIQNDD